MDEDDSGAPPLFFPTLVQESSFALVAGERIQRIARATSPYHVTLRLRYFRYLPFEHVLLPALESGCVPGLAERNRQSRNGLYAGQCYVSRPSLPQRSDVRPVHTEIQRLKLTPPSNETLRLQPVVPNGVQRVLSPKSEGIIISGK